MIYWENRPWLGLGPSAASYLGGIRFRGEPDLVGYLAAASAGQPEFVDIERLTGLASAGEAIMLALRLRRGLDVNEFVTRYGVDVRQQFAGPIARHIESGMLRWHEGWLQLTEEALPVADSVLVDFIAAAPE